MEERIQKLIFSINNLKKELQKKELELWNIRQNCQHLLSINYEITHISASSFDGSYQTHERAFRTCQKCGKRVYIE